MKYAANECRCNLKCQPHNYIEILRTTPVNTVCPNFYLLDHAHGCGFACSYCFLKDEEYGRGNREVFTDSDKLLAELKEWIARDDLESYLANAGNMADSLAFEKVRPLWGELIEFMRENAEAKGKPHCLLLVTKAGLTHCQAFFEHKPCRNIIVSFSINAAQAAMDHEKGAATTEARLLAAKRLIEAGWRVRVRIDPMIDGYDYRPLVEKVRELAPERVTLGTLRADPTLMPEVDGVRIFNRLAPPAEEGSIARYPRPLRMGMYKLAVDRLKDVTSIGLCEETPDVWEELGLDLANKTCNCNPL